MESVQDGFGVLDSGAFLVRAGFDDVSVEAFRGGEDGVADFVIDFSGSEPVSRNERDFVDKTCTGCFFIG